MNRLRVTHAKRVGALLGTVAVAAGLAASPVSAAPPGTPVPKHAGCTWNGEPSSHGSTHDEGHARSDGKTDWVTYKCVDGEWVFDKSWTSAKPRGSRPRAVAAPPGGTLAPPRR